MYFDIKELPFRKIYDKEALRDCLVNETFREDSYENDMEYTEKYIQYDSIDAAKNMAELVFMEICVICQRSITILTKKRNEEFCTIQT